MRALIGSPRGTLEPGRIISCQEGETAHHTPVAVFLASPAARYLVCETIEVNGGMLMD